MFKKTILMRNAVFVLLSAFFLSCEDPTEIGFSGIGNGDKAYFTDTLNLEIETYQLDSLITSGQTAALVGGYDDPYFGRIQASAYLQPTLPQSTNSFTGALETAAFEFTSDMVYDSLSLRLANRSLLFFGDSTSRMTLNVHRLNSALENQNYNYDSEVSYDPTPLVSLEIDRSSMVNDTGTVIFLDIILPDEVAQELIDISKDGAISDRETFERAFPGFVLVASDDAEAVSAFNIGSQANANNTNSSLVLFYHESGSEDVRGYTFDYTSGRFNHLDFDRSNTAISDILNAGDSKSASETEGNIFVQAASGLAGRITFPELSQLQSKQIGYAELEFKADTSTFSEEVGLAPFITFITLNEDGSVARNNSNYSYVSTSLNATSGILSTYDDSLNVFNADITPYIQDIASGKARDNGLVLAAAIPASSGTNGLVFGSALNRIILRDFKLKLYYSK